MTDVLLSVSTYIDAKLGPDSDTGRELLVGVVNEARLGRLRLSDYIGTTPVLLTPNMANWYRRYAQPIRGTALNDIEKMFYQVRSDQDSSGIFLERRLDILEQSRIERKRQIRTSHREQNPAKYEHADKLQGELAKVRNEYATLRASHGREPELTHWWYWVLLALIGVAEAFINFEAFSSLRFMTPIVALGATIVIAGALAGSSHVHGSFLKQWGYLFGEHRKDDEIWKNIRIFSFATASLFAILLAVGYARSNYLADAVTAAAMIGGGAPNWLGIVGGSLIMNVIVWACGVFLAFYFHDEDPEFPKKHRSQEKAHNKLKKIREEISNEINRKFNQTDAEIDRDIVSAKGQNRSLSGHERHKAAQEMLDLLTRQDAEVLSTLDYYRSELIRAARETTLIVEVPDKSNKDSYEEISLGSYAAQNIVLKYI